MMIEEIVKLHTNALVRDLNVWIAESLAPMFVSGATTKPAPAAPARTEKPAPARTEKPAPAKTMSDERMRCRFAQDGKRCKNRSSGPRFQYRCPEHRLSATHRVVMAKGSKDGK